MEVQVATDASAATQAFAQMKPMLGDETEDQNPGASFAAQ